MRRFQASCEAAAIAWDVPALAVGMSVGGDAPRRSRSAVTRTRASGSPRSRSRSRPRLALDAARPRGADRRLARRRADPPPALAHERLRLRAAGDLARFGDGDDALGGCRRRAARRAPLPGRRAGVVVREHGLLARRPARRRAGRLDASRMRSRARVLEPAGLESTSFGEPELAGTGAERRAGPYPRARRPSGRARLERRPTCSASGSWHLAEPGSARLRVAARQADRRRLRARPLRRAGRRRRGLGPRRLVRRLPVVAPRRSRPRRGLRRADEQQPRRARRCASSRTRSSSASLGARRPRRRAGRARRTRYSTAYAGTYANSGGRLRRDARAATGSSLTLEGDELPGPRDRRAHVRDHRRRRASASGSTSRSRASAASAAGSPSGSRRDRRRSPRAIRRRPRRAPRSSPPAAAPPTQRWPRASPRAWPRR